MQSVTLIRSGGGQGCLARRLLPISPQPQTQPGPIAGRHAARSRHSIRETFPKLPTSPKYVLAAANLNEPSQGGRRSRLRARGGATQDSGAEMRSRRVPPGMPRLERTLPVFVRAAPPQGGSARGVELQGGERQNRATFGEHSGYMTISPARRGTGLAGRQSHPRDSNAL